MKNFRHNASIMTLLTACLFGQSLFADCSRPHATDVGKKTLSSATKALEKLKCVVDCCNRNTELLSDISDKLPCEHIITAKDINPNGLVITQSGSWCLGEDVVYIPAGTNPAITIAAPNVTLDLNTHTLALAAKPSNQLPAAQALINGIQVNNGFDNIAIQNGIIEGFSWTGIYINPTQTAPGNKYLSIKNIHTINNGLQRFNAGTVQMGGLVIAKATDLTIENSSFIANAFSGATLVDVIKATLVNSHFDDNVSSGISASTTSVFTGGLFASGSTPGATSDMFIKNCTFNRNYGEGVVEGAQLRTAPGTTGSVKCIVIESSQFNETRCNVISNDYATNSTATSQARPRAVGLEINGVVIPVGPENTSNVVIRTSQSLRCSAVQNPSNVIPKPIGAGGMSLFNTNAALLEDCACENHTVSSVNIGTGITALYSTAAGFQINRALEATLRRCVASNNINPLGFGLGFNTGSNIGTNNQGTPPVFISGGTQLFFEDCIAQNNHGAQITSTPPTFSTPLGAGFNIKSVTNVTMKGCTAELNDIGIFVSEESPVASVATSNNIFSKNTLLNNTYYGILDRATYSAAGIFYSAYLGNIAKQNGPTPDSTNYFSTNTALFPTATCPAPGCVPSSLTTPVRQWILPAGPCPVNTNCVAGDKLDNISIRQ